MLRQEAAPQYSDADLKKMGLQVEGGYEGVQTVIIFDMQARTRQELPVQAVIGRAEGKTTTQFRPLIPVANGVGR